MRKYLRICIVFWACMCVVASQAQVYTVKSVNLLNSDLYARKNVRNDMDGNPCAIVRLNIVGVEDLQFPDAVGDVKYSLGEYIIYVPENIPTLKLYNKEKTIENEIVFEDWGFDSIEKLRVYRVVLDSENKTRFAIFSIYPQNANLKFNGKEVKLDDMGMGMEIDSIGEYIYEVSAEGYESTSGQLSLSEENISTISNIILQQKQYSIKLNCNVPDAVLYVDNVSQGEVNQNHELYLSEGKHFIRLVAPKYKDYEKQIYVNENINLDIEMDKMKQKVIKYREERSRTKVSVRNASYIKFGIETRDLLNENDFYSREKCKLEYAYSFHFWGIGEFNIGIGLGAMLLFKDSDLAIGGSCDVPLQVGFGIPFGQYNKHLFSVLIGGYANVYGMVVDFKETETYDANQNLGTDYDYGLRTTVKLDISKLSIGLDLSQSLNDGGLYSGITIGLKIY